MLKFNGFDLDSLLCVLLDACDRIQAGDTNGQGNYDNELSDEKLPVYREFETCNRIVRFVDPSCASAEIERVFAKLLEQRGDVAKSLIHYIKTTQGK